VALACVPALAYLALLALNQIMPELSKPFAELRPQTQHWVQTVTVVAGGGGFIITSLLWATALAHMIDGRVRALVATLVLAAVFSWFGVIHSPLPSSPILSPGAVILQLDAQGRGRAAAYQTPYHFAGAYGLLALALLALSRFGTLPVPTESEIAPARSS
jgi:AGZA family xanthine/uracil permease-like MFS transporter